MNNKSLLDTDFGSVQGVAYNPLRRLRSGRLRRRRVHVDIAIAPWSHAWGDAYYEFVIHVLSKLCWIKETLDPATWDAAKICYPLFDTHYERQYLSLLGLHEDALLHTKYIEPVPRSLIISNLQAVRQPTPTRLVALRKSFLPRRQERKHGGRRIYLSREGEKRAVLNEAEVRQLVSSYDLEIIDSMRVNVEEQIRTFSEASLIVSPHGATLTNLVWCSPGTRVIELFPRSFVGYAYSYLSALLGFHYTCLVDNARESHHWTHGARDLTVDVQVLARTLEDAMA